MTRSNYICRALCALGFVVGLFCTTPGTAAPIFTGFAPGDFTDPATVTVTDPSGNDVGMPLPLAGRISGNDMEDLRLYYDPFSDILYVGINTYTIAGDVDDDGDAGFTGPELVSLGGVDLPLFGGSESFVVLFDVDEDGVYDVVAGVSGNTDCDGYSVAEFSGSPLTPAFAFGAVLPAHVNSHYPCPTTSHPHLEFEILNFSQMPFSGPLDLSPGFGITAFIGSISDDGIGEDFLPAAGETVPVCFDSDQDGYTACEECNDLDADIHPGADEFECNNVDDDCDGATDEDYVETPTDCGVGECYAEGQIICDAGEEVDTCQPGQPVGPDDDCDLIDEDCDGSADEDYVGDPTSCGVGVCAADGEMVCEAGQELDTCVPGQATGPDDNCNLIDEDCDGSADEDYVPTPTECALGVCASTGELICEAGDLLDTCQPGDPTGADDDCDLIDDDCDGEADEHYAPVPTDCGVGECYATGDLICVNGDILDTCQEGSPSSEVCDLLDNDCDGAIDENLGETTCGVGECERTVANCVNGEPQDCVPGKPLDEICDLLDNDCDGEIDEEVEGVGYVLFHDGQQYLVPPLWYADQPIGDFYGYGTPDNASANTPLGLEDSNSGRTLAFLYAAGAQLDFVAIHDKPNDGSGGILDSLTGGMSMGAALSVFDDPPGGADTYATDGLGYFTIHHEWLACCTDGFAIAGPFDNLDETQCFDANFTFVATQDGVDRSEWQVAFATQDPTGGVTAIPLANGETFSVCRASCCPDLDEDGYTTCDGDCDDGDPTINPGAEEVCDGIDNDCDDATDEDLGETTCGVGECERTVDNCVDGQPQDCVPGEAEDEICDGLDNDCDGATDEELGETTCGVGECERTVDNCVDGQVQDCVPGDPMDEICDLLDNDCDGEIDEDIEGVGYVLFHGADQYTVAPLWHNDWPIADFYNYGSPDNASANTPIGLEDSNSGRSLAFLYLGDGQLDFVAIHDQPNDGSGGILDSYINGMSTSAAVSVYDDQPRGSDTYAPDGFGGFVMHHQWWACCTDGFAVAPPFDNVDETQCFDAMFAFAEPYDSLVLSEPEVTDDSGWQVAFATYDPTGALVAIPLADAETFSVCRASCCPDLDEDGYTTCDGDCDDGDPTINPGAEDLCDGIDNDCDGITDPVCPCPRSKGYWKTHPHEWPVDEIEIGGVMYEKWDAIWNLLMKGYWWDPTRKLAAQLVAAKLNLIMGSPVFIQPTVDAADAFLVLHPIGSHLTYDERKEALLLKDRLDDYNNGINLPVPCYDEEEDHECWWLKHFWRKHCQCH